MKTRLPRGAMAMAMAAGLCGGCDALESRAKEVVPRASSTGGAADESSRVPGNAPEFLRALQPFPAPNLRLHYTMAGPGGLRGELTIDTAEGGFRRQEWSMTAKGMDGDTAMTRGLTIETPRWKWTRGEGDAPARFVVRPLDLIARGYVAKSPAVRRAIFATIRQWHEDLRRSRLEHPGDTELVAGETCLRTRVAAQTLCLWEASALPLRYESAEFTLQVTEIQRPASVPADLYHVDGAPADFPGGGLENAEILLRDLEAGNYAGLATALASPLL